MLIPAFYSVIKTFGQVLGIQGAAIYLKRYVASVLQNEETFQVVPVSLYG